MSRVGIKAMLTRDQAVAIRDLAEGSGKTISEIVLDAVYHDGVADGVPPDAATVARIVAAGDRVIEAAYELDAAELAYVFLSITRRGGLGEARDRRDRAQGALREALIAHNAARAAGAHDGRE